MKIKNNIEALNLSMKYCAVGCDDYYCFLSENGRCILRTMVHDGEILYPHINRDIDEFYEDQRRGNVIVKELIEMRLKNK